MSQSFVVFVLFFIVIFSIGFFTGYFLDRSSIAYTSSELTSLRGDIENLQLQELFIAGENVDCRLMFTTMGSIDYNLYELVNSLKKEDPDSPRFVELKEDADLLSLKAWLLSRNIKGKCAGEIVPILHFYTSNCPECEEQDEILQRFKSGRDEVWVFSVDFSSNDPSLKLVKDAYSITTVPALIVEHKLYGKTSLEELESILKEVL